MNINPILLYGFMIFTWKTALKYLVIKMYGLPKKPAVQGKKKEKIKTKNLIIKNKLTVAKWGSEVEGADLAVGTSNRTRGNGTKLSQDKLRLGIRKRFFSGRKICPWK